MHSRLAYDQAVTHVRASDSTVLAYVMKTLNDRYRYGLDLYLLSIDEGITGYRDDSLEVRVFYMIGLMTMTSLETDSQAKPAAIRLAPQDSYLRRALRLDNGRDRL